MQTVSQSTTSKQPRLDAATYSLAEFAALMGIGYTKAHEMAQAGTLPVTPLRIGRQYKFPKAHVDRMLGLDDVDETGVT
jgi:excisionase family DNA binding protein